MQHNDRYQQAKKVTLIGALINALLGLMKLVGGLFFHSHALIADGVHSFSDLFTDAMVLVASKYGSQDADDKHPYGHQRIETAATLLLAMLLILAGSGIAWDAVIEIMQNTVTMPNPFAMLIAILSIFANEALFHYTRRVGNRIHSPLIIANAWHHRSDAAASGVVLVGLLGSILGFKLLDPIAAIIIGGMIIKMGISYGWNSVKELIDTGIDAQQILAIETMIQQVDGVQRIHQLRTRMMGRDIYVDVHVLVEPFISVSEGHHIAQRVHQTLIDNMQHIKDVTVHVDPEDDEIASPSLSLPSRHGIEHALLHQWQRDFPMIQSWTVHYLDGKIHLDIVIDPQFDQWSALQQRFKEDLSNYPDISKIHVLSSQDIVISR